MSHNISAFIGKTEYFKGNENYSIKELNEEFCILCDYPKNFEETIPKLVSVHTDYFGGFGEQKASYYEFGVEIYKGNTEDGDNHPINTALKKLGVIKNHVDDEFDTIHLGRYRGMDDIFEDEYDLEINEKKFKLLISEETIQNRITELAEEITNDYYDKQPLFIGIMNGCFMFASDLFKQIEFPSEISFIKLLSYKGTSTTNNVIHSIGMEQSVKGRHVIILEDIIDTGTTLNNFLPELRAQNPASIKIASCLFKPNALKHDITPDYVGFNIENGFIVGYGMDFFGFGRNNKNIYIEL